MTLIAVFVALALAYTYPVRVYLAQESQIAQLQADKAANKQAIAQTTQALAKWNDPVYIAEQAKAQLYYVRQGDAVLLVINNQKMAATKPPAKTPAALPSRWYDTLWNSVRAADSQ